VSGTYPKRWAAHRSPKFRTGTTRTALPLPGNCSLPLSTCTGLRLCVVLCCVVLCCAVLCCAVLFCLVLFCPVLSCFVLKCSVQVINWEFRKNCPLGSHLWNHVVHFSLCFTNIRCDVCLLSIVCFVTRRWCGRDGYPIAIVAPGEWEADSGIDGRSTHAHKYGGKVGMTPWHPSMLHFISSCLILSCSILSCFVLYSTPFYPTLFVPFSGAGAGSKRRNQHGFRWFDERPHCTNPGGGSRREDRG
jgi:hypothetical protein